MILSNFEPGTRVHVVGCPRSGTTLMAELLRYAYGFAGAAEHEQSLFVPVPAGSYPFLSKKPSDTVRIGRAFEADSALFVIALIRDPRSVVTSVHWSKPGAYFVDFARWRSYTAAILRYQDHPRYLVVRYEDLLRSPERVQRRIDAHLDGLDRLRSFSSYPEGCDAMHHHAQAALNGVRVFDASRINAWHAHRPRLRSEWDANPDLPDALIALGYEFDAQWTEALELAVGSGVTVKATARSLPARLEAHLRYWFRTRTYLRARANRD